MLERDYQQKLIKKIENLLPGAIILKNDSEYQPGIPDLTVFFNDRWAWLEVKKSEESDTQPNQDYFIDLGEAMSFGAFVYPENEEDVLNDLQQTFLSRRKTRLSKS